MADGPKIKISADLSNFETEIQKLQQSISSLGAKLRTETGKSELNFEGPHKQLSSLIAQADKLTAALSKTDKTSASYAKNLKAAAEAMAAAAKLSSKIETAGGSRTQNVSNYFSTYSGELSGEAAGLAGQAALDRERARTEARRNAEQQQRNAQLINRASRFAGFAGGTLLGGGGGYSAFGAGVGSMFGPIGGALGGAVGGFVDRNIGGNKTEAIKYSELRRLLGGVTADFENLRNSVRLTTAGLGVTSVEAAELSKMFAKLSGSHSTDDIARSVGTSAQLALGYGIENTQTTDFFATMRLNGIGKNDLDNKRLALQIGEAVARSGSTGKMDEMLQVVSSYVKNSATQNFITPNYGDFSSFLSSLTGSGYAGLSKNPLAAAGLIGKADNGVLSGGSMGEASGFQWLQARQRAIPGMSALDDSLFKNAGSLGMLGDQIKPGTPVYDNASPGLKKHFDQLRASLGDKTNTDIGLEHINSISRNDYERNINIQHMFGLDNPQQAAVFERMYRNRKSLGGLEGQLKGYGISLDGMDSSKLASYAEVMAGNDSDRKSYYQNIKKNLIGKDLDAGEKAFTEGGKSLTDFLIKEIEKGITDPGLEAQKTAVDLQNKMIQSLDKLLGVDTIMKDAVLEMLKTVSPANPVILRDLHARMNNTESLSSVDTSGNTVSTDDVSGALERIRAAKTKDEKMLIAKAWMGKYDAADGAGYPENTKRMILNAVDSSDSAPPSSEQPTLLQYTGGNDYMSRLMADNPGLKDYQAAAVMGNLAHESNNFRTLQEVNGSGYGWAQWTGSRKAAFEAFARNKGLSVSDPEANYAFLNHELHGSEKSALSALMKTNNLHDATLSFQKQYERPGIDHFDSRLRYAHEYYDQIPESQRVAAKQDAVNVNVGGKFVLEDKRGTHIAEPVYVNSIIGKPYPAGLM